MPNPVALFVLVFEVGLRVMLLVGFMLCLDQREFVPGLFFALAVIVLIIQDARRKE